MGLTAYVTRDPDSKQLVLERSVTWFRLETMIADNRIAAVPSS